MGPIYKTWQDAVEALARVLREQEGEYCPRCAAANGAIVALDYGLGFVLNENEEKFWDAVIAATVR